MRRPAAAMKIEETPHPESKLKSDPAPKPAKPPSKTAYSSIISLLSLEPLFGYFKHPWVHGASSSCAWLHWLAFTKMRVFTAAFDTLSLAIAIWEFPSTFDRPKRTPKVSSARVRYPLISNLLTQRWDTADWKILFCSRGVKEIFRGELRSVSSPNWRSAFAMPPFLKFQTWRKR